MARYLESASLAPWLSLSAPAADPPGPPDDGALARTIESEIIPRLMLLHRDAGRRRPGETLSASHVSDFANLVLSGTGSEAFDYIARLQGEGVSSEAVLLDLLAPCARLLGDLWREDLCSFGEVTVGLSRLQAILRRLGGGFEDRDAALPDGRTAFLAPVPGEQHSFGLGVVASFLRKGGWDVEEAWTPTEGSVAASVRARSYDLVGFSLSGDRLLDVLASTIEAVRRFSRNPAVKVIVGGRFFVAHPEMIGRVGADAAALDARDAALTSDRLVRRAAARVVRSPSSSE